MPIEEKTVKRFRVRMLKGYFPGDPSHPRHPLSKDPEKVSPGTEIDLPIDEARYCIKNGIAERADEIPLV